MEKFAFKLLQILLVYLIEINQTVNCATPIVIRRPQNICNIKYQNRSLATTFVYDAGTVKAGDELQCQVVNVTLIRICNTHLFTQRNPDAKNFVFVPTSKNSNCFSFQVRSDKDVHIVLNNMPSVGSRFEIAIDNNDKNSLILKNSKTQTSVPTPTNIINDKELKPFWIRYDNNLLEVGYGNSNTPFLSKQFTSADGFPSPVNDVGVLSHAGLGEWIIDADPVCGINNRTETPPRHEVKTVCKVKPKVKLLVKITRVVKKF